VFMFGALKTIYIVCLHVKLAWVHSLMSRIFSRVVKQFCSYGSVLRPTLTPVGLSGSPG